MSKENNPKSPKNIGKRIYKKVLYKINGPYTRQEAEIIKSGIFDAEYYVKANKDLDFEKYPVEPIFHFLKSGIHEFRNPNRDFDTFYYLTHNADKFNFNPVYHYIKNKDNPNMVLDVSPVVDDIPSSKRRNNTKSAVVDIINLQFFDFSGEVLYKGGAERYIFDLAVLIKKMGYTPRILQAADHHFVKSIDGIEVIGCKTGSTDMETVSKFFDNFCKKSRLVIASPLELASHLKNNVVIGINHGIYWDTANTSLSQTAQSGQPVTVRALQNINTGVCVDTNFINWTRTRSHLLSKKLCYIPNYYDEEVFKPNKKDFDHEICFVYSRRIVDYRGWGITYAAFQKILKKHSDVKLQIVGQPHDDKAKREVETLLRKFPSQCSWSEKNMDEMADAYQDSQVALVPTLWSEGTSLSCIEAMASGNTVIATNVGGLPNLIIDGFNGLLIDPDEGALLDACETLISDRKLAKQMAENAKKVVKCFTKTKWQSKWEQILKENGL